MVRIRDTLLRDTVELTTREPGKVSFYVCGPTVYDTPHIGNARTAVAFDTIRRYLEWAGFEVTYVSNVTDVEDKIIARAAAEGRTETDVSPASTRRSTSITWLDSEFAMPITDRTRPSTSTACWSSSPSSWTPGMRTWCPTRACTSRSRPSPAMAHSRTGPSRSCGSRRAHVSRSMRRSGARWTSRCGRPPNRASPPGTRNGAPGARVGTSNARPCRSTSSARGSISMGVART